MRIFLGVMMVFSFLFGSSAKADKPMDASAGKTLYDFTFKTIDGQDYPLSSLKGKTVLVVNTASKCGFTKQYAGLETLYKTYKDKGFVLVGVPSNDFMGQEPGSNAEIKKFCETNFGITFPIMEKESVTGASAHPLYQWLAGQKAGGTPKWNFHKFLFNREGHLVEAFNSMTAPDDSKLTAAIENALEQK